MIPIVDFLCSLNVLDFIQLVHELHILFSQKTGEEFAAKVFSAQGMSRQNYVTERELNVLKKLKECTHENIVKVIEIEKEVTTL